jgi:hypothetical protein
MIKERTKLSKNEVSNLIEDLTVNETAATEIKGGPLRIPDSFSFGVEREMKESGEKGGTE